MKIVPRHSRPSVASLHLPDQAADPLAKMLDFAAEGLFALDADGRVVLMNNVVQTICGITREELLNKPFIDFVLEADRHVFLLFRERVMSGFELKNIEIRLKQPNGNGMPVLWSARWDKADQLMYCAVRKESEKQLAESPIQQHNPNALGHAGIVSEILERMQDGFFIMDADWRVTYFNKEAERLTGKTKEEMIGNIFWEVFPTAVNTIAYQQYHRAVSDQVQVSFEFHSQLFKAWFEVIAYPLKNGISVYFKNISLRKKQELENVITRQRYDLLAKATSDALWDWNLETNECYFSEAFGPLFGYKENADDVFKIWLDNIYEEDKKAMLESLQSALEFPIISRWDREYRFYRADRSVAFVLNRGFIIRNEEGKALRMVGAMQDISRLKKAEDELKTLSLIAKETVNAVVVTDAEERITWVNKAFTAITEYTLEEVLGKKPNEFIQGPKTSPKIRAFMRQHIQNGLPFACDIINYSKSGREYWMDLRVQPILDNTGRVSQFFSIQTDITERIELQKLVIQEKIEAQQMITRAIIETQEKERTEIAKELHDNVIQIIATIKLYIGNIRICPEDQEMFINKSIELADLAIDESRNLAHHLITPAISDLGFKSAIEQLLSHYRNLKLFDIDFQFTLCEDKVDKEIRLTIYRIVQECINNIVKYAQASKVYVGLLYEDGFVKVIVQDDGVGFDPQLNGEGIGLLNIQNRASLFRGQLYLESEKGKGTKLSVHFPTVEDQMHR